jgi:Cof subfamily protein (haloacid dehalogenase superfamily)
MAVKLVISDVDGTLVRSDKTLADATVRAVGLLKKAGIPMSLISARPASGLQWIAEALDLEGPFGAFNGGTLFNREGTITAQHFIEQRAAEAALDLLSRAGVAVWIFTDGQWFASDLDNPHIVREIRSASVDPILMNDIAGVPTSRIDKIVGVCDVAGTILSLESDVRAAIGDMATVAHSQAYYLDITATTANKGDGIRSLATSYGVSLSEVAVLGDQANDLAMFARAGLSIAMGQAPAEVRAAATATSTSNDEDGVARAIENIILPVSSSNSLPGGTGPSPST